MTEENELATDHPLYDALWELGELDRELRHACHEQDRLTTLIRALADRRKAASDQALLALAQAGISQDAVIRGPDDTLWVKTYGRLQQAEAVSACDPRFRKESSEFAAPATTEAAELGRCTNGCGGRDA